jgi:hypothetical protein
VTKRGGGVGVGTNDTKKHGPLYYFLFHGWNY